METNVILKYRRPKDCWLCPECDSENDISVNHCFVCNCARPMGIELLRKWNPNDDREIPPPKPPKPSKKTPNPPRPETGPIFRDYDMPPPPPPPPGTSSAVGVIWGIIIAIIILTILFMAVASGRLQALPYDFYQEPNFHLCTTHAVSTPKDALYETLGLPSVSTADQTISERQANQT